MVAAAARARPPLRSACGRGRRAGTAPPCDDATEQKRSEKKRKRKRKMEKRKEQLNEQKSGERP